VTAVVKAALISASRCDGCGDVRLPAVERCPECRGSAVRPVVLEGRGTVLAVSEVHTPQRDGETWTAVLAEVDHGVRLVGLGSPPLATGDAVVPVGEHEGVPVFARRGGEAANVR
jgi:uncharacterized OB-fold protein